MILYQSRHDATEYGRLAQLVEHLLDVKEVTGSNPILYEKGFGYVFCLSEILRKDYTER